jgi:serine/threonine protein kinase HipA of HipAB toxin-antitoxin module
MALDVARTLPAGSSAGGEQPKFLAVLQGERSAPEVLQHVIVKFTPPHDTPFGQRWRDLLLAEHLAAQVLTRHGIAAARTRIEATDTRTYLISERFDRFGAHGRCHAVSIGAVHKAFVPDSYTHWAASSAALARQGRLPDADHHTIATLLAFGRLIGNCDMHAGNLALFVALDDLRRGRFRLAPAYDMLPMRWRPSASLGGNPDYAPFEPDQASLSSPAAAIAADYWQALAGHDGVSAALREVAAAMGARLLAPPAGRR